MLHNSSLIYFFYMFLYVICIFIHHIYFFFFSELCWGKAMVAYTKPQQGGKKKAKG